MRAGCPSTRSRSAFAWYSGTAMSRAPPRELAVEPSRDATRGRAGLHTRMHVH